MPTKIKRRSRRQTASDAVYTVWQSGETRTATAREILLGIQKNAQASGELKSMSVQNYATALVDDAGFFLPKKLLAYFHRQAYAPQFDRALEYLAAMPTSGVRILKRGA